MRPSIITGNASGIFTFHNNWLFEQPIILAASITVSGRFLKPCSVYLIAGTNAYAIIASNAVNSPILKIITNGIKITKDGIVCMVSLIGLINADTLSLWAAQIPKDEPIKNEIITAIPHK